MKGFRKNLYIVQPGDHLYSIAVKFNTTVEKIASFNHLINPVLFIGQQLMIPIENSELEAEVRQREYKAVTAYTATRPIYVNGVDINTGLYPVLNFKPGGATYPYIYVPIAEFSRVGAKVVWDPEKQVINVTSDYDELVKKYKNLETENEYLKTLLKSYGIQLHGNTSDNIRQGGFVAKQGDWIYYKRFPTLTVDEVEGNLYKIKTDGTEDTKLSNDEPDYINVLGSWVYYREKLTQNIYKIKTDGTNRTKLNTDRTAYIWVVDDWIYYTNLSDGGKLYKIKTDEANKVKVSEDEAYSLNIIGDWIYYVNRRDSIAYKIKTDGTEKTKITESKGGRGIKVVGDWIYYHGDIFLYRMKLDGTSITKVSDEAVKEFNISNDRIYYIAHQAAKGGIVYKTRLDGRDKFFILKLATNINIFDDWVYYIPLENMIYKIKTDGTENQKLYQ